MRQRSSCSAPSPTSGLRSAGWAASVLSLEERTARPAVPSTPAAPALTMASPAAASPALAPVAPVQAPAGIEPGVLAALAAAVAVVVRRSHRIVAVQADGGAQRAWSAEGRREIYHSHRVR